MDDTISMTDMAMVFDVADEFGIDRETIRVDLTKEDPGSVKLGMGGLTGGGSTVKIVIPLTQPLEEWLQILRAELVRLGFRAS